MSTKLILIADDDATSLVTLSAVLKKLGYGVEEVCDGDAAWSALQRTDAPRLAILDWMMPGLSGIEVCRRIHSLQMEQPPYLILLTSRDAKADVSQGLYAGASDYISKPFDASEMAARIEVGCRMLALQARLAEKVGELQDAFAHIKTLSGFLPICSGCKKIRDDKGYWTQVEAYVSAHSDALFTHSLCPDCIPKYFPELAGLDLTAQANVKKRVIR